MDVMFEIFCFGDSLKDVFAQINNELISKVDLVM